MSRKISARCRLAPGDATKHIGHATQAITPGDRVVIAARVSRPGQRANLHGQVPRRELERQGATVVGQITYVGSGTDPYWLARAAALARKHGAKWIVAESVDRLCRHPGYHSAAWADAQARTSDLAELAYFAEGVPVATLVPPDATPAEVRAHQRKRGQRAKGARGGRPATRPGRLKRRREKLLPAVARMVGEGSSIRSIARRLKLPESTVRRWERHFLPRRECDDGE